MKLLSLIAGISLSLLGMTLWAVLIIRDNRKPKNGKTIDW